MKDLKRIQTLVRDACGIELNDDTAARLAHLHDQQLARAAPLLRGIRSDNTAQTHTDVLKRWSDRHG